MKHNIKTIEDVFKLYPIGSTVECLYNYNVFTITKNTKIKSLRPNWVELKDPSWGRGWGDDDTIVIYHKYLDKSSKPQWAKIF